MENPSLSIDAGRPNRIPIPSKRGDSERRNKHSRHRLGAVHSFDPAGYHQRRTSDLLRAIIQPTPVLCELLRVEGQEERERRKRIPGNRHGSRPEGVAVRLHDDGRSRQPLLQFAGDEFYRPLEREHRLSNGAEIDCERCQVLAVGQLVHV